MNTHLFKASEALSLVIDIVADGKHTESTHATILSDLSNRRRNFPFTADVLGKTVYNLTDESSGIITAYTSLTVTATLIGGTDNNWDKGDDYIIGEKALRNFPTGADPYFDSDGDNSVQTIKSVKGILVYLEVQNPNASDCWIQLFDESGAITVGTTTPKQSYLVSAGDGTLYGMAERENPIKFKNSIKYACTTTPTGNGDPAIGLIVNALIL